MYLLNPFLRWMDGFYSLFIKSGSNLQSAFLLYMRLTWGHQFILGGIGKYHNMEKTIEYFTSLGLHAPDLLAHFVMVLEIAGGALLVLGLASRMTGLIMSILMLSALSIAHATNLAHLRFITEPHLLVHEAPYPYFMTSLMVFVFGPGRISLDAWIKRWTEHQPHY